VAFSQSVFSPFSFLSTTAVGRPASSSSSQLTQAVAACRGGGVRQPAFHVVICRSDDRIYTFLRFFHLFFFFFSFFLANGSGMAAKSYLPFVFSIPTVSIGMVMLLPGR
jgi:hypothetical protein